MNYGFQSQPFGQQQNQYYPGVQASIPVNAPGNASGFTPAANNMQPTINFNAQPNVFDYLEQYYNQPQMPFGQMAQPYTGPNNPIQPQQPMFFNQNSQPMMPVGQNAQPFTGAYNPIQQQQQPSIFYPNNQQMMPVEPNPQTYTGGFTQNPFQQPAVNDAYAGDKYAMKGINIINHGKIGSINFGENNQNHYNYSNKTTTNTMSYNTQDPLMSILNPALDAFLQPVQEQLSQDKDIMSLFGF